MFFLYKHSFFLNLNFRVQAYILIYFILQCIHIIYSLKVAWVWEFWTQSRMNVAIYGTSVEVFLNHLNIKYDVHLSLKHFFRLEIGIKIYALSSSRAYLLSAIDPFPIYIVTTARNVPNWQTTVTTDHGKFLFINQSEMDAVSSM